MLKPCIPWAEHLSAYLDDEADALTRDQVDEHLVHCPACRAAVELYRCNRRDNPQAPPCSMHALPEKALPNV